MTDLFGPGLKAQLLETINMPEVPDEAKLLQAVCDKVGPSANKEKLLWHLRASRGKVHWAVNSYLRAVLTTSLQQPGPAREDFDPKPPIVFKLALQQQQHVASASAAHAYVPAEQQQQLAETLVPQLAEQEDSAVQDKPSASSPAAVQLDGLPGNVLEQVLSCLDLACLLSAACSCQALNRAAQAEGLWRGLFQLRWGALLFPVNTAGSGTGSSNSSNSRSNPCGQMPAATAAATASAGVERALSTPAIAQMQQQQGPARTPVPLFGAQAQGSAALPAAAADSSHRLGSASGAAGCPDRGQQLPRQQQQQQQRAAGSSSLRARQELRRRDSDFVTRWTGSSCVAPRSTSAGQQHTAAQLATLTTQSAVAAKAVLPAAVGAAAASSPIAQSPRATQMRPQSPCQAAQQQQQQQPEGLAAEQLPLVAPCGSWQLQFKQQYAYQAARLCPKCGVSSIVPIVYGFPSPGLLAGMAVKRLVLGGDHLIESCHVWACAGCRSCFRFYPYLNVQLWVQDDAAQQRQDHARAAAASGRRGRQGGVGGAAEGAEGVGGAAAQQQQQQPGAVPGSDAAGDGFPRYTYEL